MEAESGVFGLGEAEVLVKVRGIPQRAMNGPMDRRLNLQYTAHRHYHWERTINPLRETVLFI